MPLLGSAIRKYITHVWLQGLLNTLERQVGRSPGVTPDSYVAMHEDFIQDAGVTINVPWALQDTSAAGAPTKDYVAGADAGEFKLQFAVDAEVETLTLYHADKLYFDATKKPIIEGRIKIAGTAGAVLPTGTRVVFGIASARNATLDSIVTNAWFRLEGSGAGRAILCEVDDGTTDSDDQSTGVSYAEGTYLKLLIDMSTLSAVKFYINDALVKTLSIPLATGNLQPYLEMQKGADAGTVAVTVDYIRVSATR